MIDGFKVFGDAIASWVNTLDVLPPNSVTRRNLYAWMAETSAEVEGFVTPTSQPYTTGTRHTGIGRIYVFAVAVKQNLGTAFQSEEQREARIDALNLIVDRIEKAAAELRSLTVAGNQYSFGLFTDGGDRVPFRIDSMHEAKTYIGGINVAVSEL